MSKPIDPSLSDVLSPEDFASLLTNVPSDLAEALELPESSGKSQEELIAMARDAEEMALDGFNILSCHNGNPDCIKAIDEYGGYLEDAFLRLSDTRRNLENGTATEQDLRSGLVELRAVYELMAQDERLSEEQREAARQKAEKLQEKIDELEPPIPAMAVPVETADVPNNDPLAGQDDDLVADSFAPGDPTASLIGQKELQRDGKSQSEIGGIIEEFRDMARGDIEDKSFMNYDEAKTPEERERRKNHVGAIREGKTALGELQRKMDRGEDVGEQELRSALVDLRAAYDVIAADESLSQADRDRARRRAERLTERIDELEPPPNVMSASVELAVIDEEEKEELRKAMGMGPQGPLPSDAMQVTIGNAGASNPEDYEAVAGALGPSLSSANTASPPPRERNAAPTKPPAAGFASATVPATDDPAAEVAGLETVRPVVVPTAGMKA